jgi:predicted transcriptional regulator
MPSATLSIRVEASAKERLQALAETTGRSSSYLAAEAIEQYLAVQEWQIGAIMKGIASADAGLTVPDEAVSAWIESLGTEDELPMPQAKRP